MSLNLNLDLSLNADPNAPKTDPRVLRTRVLIQEAFISLIKQKDIKDITVRDITGKAKVNRATFYAHFTDKYDLLDVTITNSLRGSLMQKIRCQDKFSLETLTNLIVMMCEIHEELSTQCPRSYESLGPYMEIKMKEELQASLAELLRRRNGLGGTDKSDESAASTAASSTLEKSIATMLSWCIYGIAHAWNKDGRKAPPAELAGEALKGLTETLAGLPDWK